MPDLLTLPAGAPIQEDDEVVIVRGDQTYTVTVAQLLTGLQATLAIAQGTVLGRAVVGTGAPAALPLGSGVALSGGAVVANAADHLGLPVLGGMDANADLIANSAGAPVRLPWVLVQAFLKNQLAWLDGSGPPSGGLGVPDDYYIDNVTADFYRKTVNGWVLRGNFRGVIGQLSIGAGLTSSGGALVADVQSVAGRTGDVMVSTADLTDVAAVGQPNGVASLGPNGRLNPAQVPSGLTSGITARGVWNADTNTPTLASGVGTNGDVWAVSVAGDTALDSALGEDETWAVGDQAWYSDGWHRVPFSTVMASIALTSLASLGFSDGTVITPRLSLVRKLLQTWTRNGDIAGAIRDNGALWFALAQFGTVSAGAVNADSVDATDLDAVNADIDVAAILEGTLAGVRYSRRALARRWLNLWLDELGNGALGLRPNGLVEIGAAKIKSLEAETFTMTGGASGGVANNIVAASPLVRGLSHYEVDAIGHIASAINLRGQGLALPRPAIIARAVHQAVKPTMVHTYTPPKTAPDQSVPSGTTIATLWSMRLGFEWVRIIAGHQATGAAAMTAIVAPTAHPNDGINPVDGAGDPVSWTQLKANNGGALTPTPWNQATGSAVSLAMNPGDGVEVWGLAASDWQPVSSLPRSDGGAYPLLMVRVYLTGLPGAVTATPSTKWMGLTPASYAFGRSWAAYTASGDHVSSVGAFPVSGTDFGSNWAPLMIQTYSRAWGFQMWGCGDSNMAGTGSQDGLLGFYRGSGLALDRRFPVIEGNLNQPGSDPPTYMGNVANLVDAIRPSALVMFPFSFNGGAATQAKLDSDWARGMLLAERTLRHGGVPALMGYPPRPAMSAEQDAIRLQSLERIDAAAAAGMLAINTNAQIAVPGTPQTWVPGTSDVAAMHYSEIGHRIVAERLTAGLAHAFGIY